MSNFISAKQILLSYDIKSPKDENGEKIRGTAHEFQDYAYRLATFLNDVSHLHIYMGLTKRIPRFILEKTYEAIADIPEENKGKLFMWKLKQIRSEMQMKKDIKNFDYDHVIKKMRDVRNKHALNIIKKYDARFNEEYVAFLNKNLGDKELKKTLTVGNVSLNLPNILKMISKKIVGIDISKNLTNTLKRDFEKEKQCRFMLKDFLKNSFKDSEFDFALVNLWNMVPLACEDQYFKQLYRVIKENGSFVLETKCSDSESECWKQLQSQGNDQYFEKINRRIDLEKRILKNGFNVQDVYEGGNSVYYYIVK